MAVDLSIYKPEKLIPEEEESRPSLIASIGAGVATGLIRIPEGAASLFASICDVTHDTETALDVEKWFDDNIYNKLGDIDEKAEATTAGKITAALVNIGIPGGLAFRFGSKAASGALKAVKDGKYFTLNNPALAKAGQDAIKLNTKGKTARFIAGATAGGTAEGVFVADVEDFGTLGDLLGGPTALSDESAQGGREQATRNILNRVKFGTEGALLTGVLGGTGSLIKTVATRGKELKYSRSLKDRILNRMASGFRPRGDTPEQFFLTKGEQLGKKSADLNRAVELSRNVDRVFFVENDKNAIKILRKNINKFNLNKKTKIIVDDVMNLVLKKQFFNEKFELIFCDPPFKDQSIVSVIALIFNRKIVKKNNIIIIHRHKKTIDEFPNYLEILDQRIYGNSKVIFCKLIF